MGFLFWCGFFRKISFRLSFPKNSVFFGGIQKPGRGRGRPFHYVCSARKWLFPPPSVLKVPPPRVKMFCSDFQPCILSHHQRHHQTKTCESQSIERGKILSLSCRLIYCGRFIRLGHRICLTFACCVCSLLYLNDSDHVKAKVEVTMMIRQRWNIICAAPRSLPKSFLTCLNLSSTFNQPDV